MELSWRKRVTVGRAILAGQSVTWPHTLLILCVLRCEVPVSLSCARPPPVTLFPRVLLSGGLSSQTVRHRKPCLSLTRFRPAFCSSAAMRTAANTLALKPAYSGLCLYQGLFTPLQRTGRLFMLLHCLVLGSTLYSSLSPRGIAPFPVPLHLLALCLLQKSYKSRMIQLKSLPCLSFLSTLLPAAWAAWADLRLPRRCHTFISYLTGVMIPMFYYSQLHTCCSLTY